MTKVCTKCGEPKPLSAFPKNGVRNGVQSYRSECKPCKASARRAFRSENTDAERERVRQWRESNPEAVHADNDSRRDRGDHARKAQQRASRLRRYQREWRRQWRKANPELARVQWRKYQSAPQDYLTHWRKAA